MLSAVRTWLFVLLAIAALGMARIARVLAANQRPKDSVEEPYAPSPEAAPIVFLGFRETAEDLLWIRFLGYWGGNDSTTQGIGALIDAMIALDPTDHRIYKSGASALQLADHGVGQDSYQHAVAVLERGIQQFPDDYKLLELAGEMYLQDLYTDDKAQRRAWDEKGVLLIESALRKPGAPPELATYAAHIRSKLGQKQKAIQNLREMILLTRDVEARKKMIDRLAQLEQSDSAELASEIYEEKHKFEAAWTRDRPTVPPTMYLLIGAPLDNHGFSLTDLATGGRDLVGSEDTAAPEAPPAD
jgi:hypothetical protein